MLLMIRLVCVAYWALLTVVLLVPDPYALLGITRLRGATPGMGVHFTFFAALAVLVLGSRWPVERRMLGGALLGFAVATEALQTLVSKRTSDPRDLLENLLGLVVGAIVWQIVRRGCFPRQPVSARQTENNRRGS